MRIEQISTQRFTTHHKFTKINHEIPWSQLLVTITTDTGLQGTGEAWWGLSLNPVESAINDTLAPFLVGANPQQIEGLWQRLHRYAYRYETEGILRCGLSALDLASWDLHGKHLDLPIAAVLGGQVQDRVKAYASLIHLGKESWIRAEVTRAVDAGFKGIKLHEYDINLVRIAREVVPTNFPIMLDVAPFHWTPRETEENAHKLSQ
jgi:L-alanine-DL-glutamate epimerase-like enolase superfamily enzyme